MQSTSNYLARRYGVRAAMPGFIAKKLCPQLVIVQSHFSKYQEVSGTVREILSNYDPLFSSVGLDEAYLDITEYVIEIMRGKEKVSVEEENGATQSCGDSSVENTESLKHSLLHQTDTKSLQIDAESPQIDSESHFIDRKSQHGSNDESLNDAELIQNDDLNCDSDQCLPSSYWECAERVVSEIRGRIHSTTQLTASAGIASNKMLAKIASDMNKPNGQYIIPPSREKILNFIRKLPIRKVPCSIFINI